MLDINKNLKYMSRNVESSDLILDYNHVVNYFGKILLIKLEVFSLNPPIYLAIFPK